MPVQLPSSSPTAPSSSTLSPPTPALPPVPLPPVPLPIRSHPPPQQPPSPSLSCPYARIGPRPDGPSPFLLSTRDSSHTFSAPYNISPPSSAETARSSVLLTPHICPLWSVPVSLPSKLNCFSFDMLPISQSHFGDLSVCFGRRSQRTDFLKERSLRYNTIVLLMNGYSAIPCRCIFNDPAHSTTNIDFPVTYCSFCVVLHDTLRMDLVICFNLSPTS